MEHNNQYKSVFLSDIHLGFNGCSVEKLKHFMDSMSCDNLFLVGDIVDLWAMKDKFYWPLSHQKMLEKFINLKNKGVNVFFITGNHDDPARSKAEFEDLKKDERFTKVCTDLENFEFIDAYDYETIDHGKILVIHGDQYDVVTSNAKWISKFGGILYDLLIKINRPISKN
jgi:UDP-2,3-diacylglucosamine pyrophosphatase LpxH